MDKHLSISNESCIDLYRDNIILESNTAILFQSPPKHTNKQLQQKINEQKSNPYVLLSRINLTCEDMKIVGYYLLQNNTIKNIFIIHRKRKIEILCNISITIYSNKNIFE